MTGTQVLLQHHDAVYAVDTERQRLRVTKRIEECEASPSFRGFRNSEMFKRMRLRLKVIYVVNVLHTIPTPEARVDILDSARRNLTKDGILVVDVPASETWYSSRMTKERSYSDGYVFRRSGQLHTFYRFCSEKELDGWAESAGFRFEAKEYIHHHRVRLYRPVAED